VSDGNLKYFKGNLKILELFTYFRKELCHGDIGFFRLAVEGLQYTLLGLVRRYAVRVFDADESVIKVLFHGFINL
jgi:hypothetical protein